MFDRVSPRYDLLNAALSLGMDRSWRRSAVAAVSPHAGRRYLDAGCGTGDIGVEVLRRSPASCVMGIDLSERMLGLAAAKVRRAGLSARVQLRVGDVTAMEFPDATFDGVLSAFCIRNVADRPAALREMRRVLAPGGRAAILELTRPRGGALRLAHRLYNRHVVPLIARVLSEAEAYRYLADSIEEFPEPGTVLTMMQQAGLAQAAARSLSGGIVTLFVADR